MHRKLKPSSSNKRVSVPILVLSLLLLALLTSLIGAYFSDVISKQFRVNVAEFACSQQPELFTAPRDGTYRLETWGAQGGTSSYGATTVNGGSGGYSVGDISLKTGDQLYVRVGCAGIGASSNASTTLAGGWNGGGYALQSSSNAYAGSGGGGTDIRVGVDNLLARVIVAGGGGGGGFYTGSNGTTAIGGYGGGATGGTGGQAWTNYGGGTGGTQTAGGVKGPSSSYSQNGSFGQGGNSTATSGGWNGSGGGGGWYGGGSGGALGDGGGGGSGYVYTSASSTSYPVGSLLSSSSYLRSAQTVSGNSAVPTIDTPGTMTGKTGNGFARISFISHAPVITLHGNNPLSVPLGIPYAEPGFSAFDEEDGNITGQVTSNASSVVDINAVGTYTITYQVTDSDGYMSTTTRQVFVTDQFLNTAVRDQAGCLDDGTECWYPDHMYTNYVWYSGYLWQVIKVNDDGTTKLELVDAVTSLSGYSAPNTTYANSFHRSWLNGDFLNTLYDSGGYIESEDFCAGNETNECSTMVNDLVGLLTYSEYNYAQSFLDLSSTRALITSDSNSSNYRWVAYPWSSPQEYNYNEVVGVHPVINIKSSIATSGGSGDFSDPYILFNDNPAESGDGLVDRRTGEYVEFAGQVWRIVSTGALDTDGQPATKLVLVDVIYENKPFDSNNSVNNNQFDPSRSSNIASYLNGELMDMARQLQPGFDEYVTSGPWYLGQYYNSSSYQTTLNTSSVPPVNATIGLPRIGEVLSANTSNLYGYSANCFSTLTRFPDNGYPEVWATCSDSVSYDTGVDSSQYVKPEIYLKGDVKISGGDGRAPGTAYQLQEKSYLDVHGNAVVNVAVGDAYNEPGYYAQDVDGSDITANVVVNLGGLNVNHAGTYTITYTVTDSDGKTMVRTRTVVVNRDTVYDICGSPETFTATTDGTYVLETWGAQGFDYPGGSSYPGTGNRGGYASGKLHLSAGTTLYLYVGCQGGTAYGGWNGGANSLSTSYPSGTNDSGSGGGASDIRINNGTGTWDDATGLYSRILVGGGGGGSRYNGNTYSPGGIEAGSAGLQNGPGSYCSTMSGGNCNSGSTAFGTFGAGGYFVTSDDTAGGGGGWYGGNTYGDSNGGGGSNYALTSSSYKPSGYFGAYASYYLGATSTIAGNQAMPSPYGGMTVGKSGDGAIRISLFLPEEDPPIITVNGSNPINVTQGGIFNDPGATAYDNQDGDITGSIVVTGSVDTSTLGTYVLTYSVTDLNGNSATATRTVVVIPYDDQPPAITILGDNPVDANVYEYYADMGATAFDDVDGVIYPTVIYDDVDYNYPGTYSIVYEACDVSGNCAQATRTVNVADNIPPTILYSNINLPFDATLQAGAAFNPLDGISYSDNYDNIYVLQSNLVMTDSVNTAVLGTYVVTYQTHDSSGNYSNILTRTITVIDTTPPVISTPKIIYVRKNATGFNFTAERSSIDNLDGNITAGMTMTGTYNLAATGDYNLALSSTDSHGNNTTKVVTIKVVENVTSYDFTCVNDVQAVFVDTEKEFTMESWGAEGGGRRLYTTQTAGLGGLGSYVKGKTTVSAGTMLYVNAGCQGQYVATAGQVAKGGYNGGGDAKAATTGASYGAFSGGGASDIRLTRGVWNDTASLRSRIMVAAGGGGAMSGSTSNSATYNGGHGGLLASNTTNGGYTASNNATQTAAGANGGFGIGGLTNCRGGGGGGGYYGGGANPNNSNYSGCASYSGGGGSSFISGATGYNAVNASGAHTSQPNHYSGYVFTGVDSVAGNGITPNPAGGTFVNGNQGDGFVRLTPADAIVVPPQFCGTATTYNYNGTNGNNGSVQTFTVVEEGDYYLEAWGAQGMTAATSGANVGGNGGYSAGTVHLNAGDVLNIYVGGSATASSAGGYNGGKRAVGTQGAGGGASDIRINGTTYYSRVIAAGGGGGSSQYSSGGVGGGVEGGRAPNQASGAATQTAGYGFGENPSAPSGGSTGGGGGGGWYAGASSAEGTTGNRGGAGGSGWVFTESNFNAGYTSSTYTGGTWNLASSYYLTNAYTLSGAESIPNPAGGANTTGRAGNGVVKVTQISGCLEPGEYTYTGAAQQYTAPVTGKYKLEVWGAQGGSTSWNAGGKGGYSVGTVNLTAGAVLNVYVGGVGHTSSAAATPSSFGGGGSLAAQTNTGYVANSASGGGASDIRVAGTSLYNRVIVAGGGGGANSYGNGSAAYSGNGGVGGGTSGGTGQAGTGQTTYLPGTGGTQTAPGSTQGTCSGCTAAAFGQGGNQTGNLVGASGGGGWYGGAASYAGGGAGGGSGWVYTSSTAGNVPASGWLLNSSHYLINAQTIAGSSTFNDPDGSTVTGHTGNGFARITLMEVEFDYANAAQSFTMPNSGAYKLEVWGAQGGYGQNDVNHLGGAGGYSVGTAQLTAGTSLFVNVGGKGGDSGASATGGYNGGGSSTHSSSPSNVSGAGGGATDVRIGANSLYARVIVAGGGGGGGYMTMTCSSVTCDASGGAGGGASGIAGGYNNSRGTTYVGTGGTQVGIGTVHLAVSGATTTPAEFGLGGFSVSTSPRTGGGGGGGWYGGNAAGPGNSVHTNGGGGGSSWLYTASSYSTWSSAVGSSVSSQWLLAPQYYLTDTSTVAGNASMPNPAGGANITGKTGNGYVRIVRME